jgi:hypothetical protein
MKLLRFYHNDEIHTGVLTDRGVADLTALGFPGTVNDVIAGGRDARNAIETLLAGGYTPCLTRRCALPTWWTTPPKSSAWA